MCLHVLPVGAGNSSGALMRRATVSCAGNVSLDRAKYPLDEAALYTMQYIVTAPVEKLYTFTVTEEVLGQVTKLIQYYMRQYVEKELKTPVFLS